VPLGPLTGFTVGIAADRRAEEQVELLRRRGARVLHGPTMRTHALEPDASFEETTRALVDQPPDITVLSTGIGVRAWIDAAATIGLADALVEALSQSEVWARGPKARGAAVTAGLPVHWHAPSGTSAELVDVLSQREGGVAGRRVAIQLDGAPEPPVVAAIAALGGDVVPVRVYRWGTPSDVRPARRLVQAICERRVDAVTFTSRPQVESLFRIADAAARAGEVRAAFADSVTAVCIGVVCADAALTAGVTDPLVPARSRLGAMVMAVADVLSARARTVHVDGFTLCLQGRAVEAGGKVVELAARERAVLDVLLERPGAVVSTTRLLTRVWPSAGDGVGDADEHAAVVTVARLRRRLAGTGVTVENVARRGYRVAHTARASA
jgi:uroporphyrinogen-III synthase